MEDSASCTPQASSVTRLGNGAANGSSVNGSGRRNVDIKLGKTLTLLVFVGLSLFSYKYIHSGELAAFVLKIQANPMGSLHVFVLFHIVAVVLLVPAMLLQAVTGALYGIGVGLAVSWIASSIGQSLAFLLGRYLFRASVKSYLVQRVPNFPQIEAAIKKEGWKLMCLLRLSPILPYNILNYAAALTPISFLAYSLSSALAIIPWTILYVYLGTLSTSVVAELARGKLVTNYHHNASPGSAYGRADEMGPGGGMSTGYMLSSGLYITLLVLSIVYGYALSKRAIKSVMKSVADVEPSSRPESEGGGQGTDVELAAAGKG